MNKYEQYNFPFEDKCDEPLVVVKGKDTRIWLQERQQRIKWLMINNQLRKAPEQAILQIHYR